MQSKEFKKRLKNFLFLISVILVPSAHLLFSSLHGDECTRNTGISFGILKDSSIQLVLFLEALFIIILASASFSILHKRLSYLVYRGLFLALIGAGMSNLIDRIAFGGICDYFKITLSGRMLSFNLNDIIIVILIGVIILIEIKGNRVKK